MYLGKIVELTDRETLYAHPLHPYTQALLSAIPVPDREIEETRQRILLEGDLPSPANPPKGCNFSTRCPVAIDICQEVDPEFIEVAPNHFCACHLVTPEETPGNLANTTI
jgi:oligopeptide transport system ATP-binding protein